MLCLCSQHNGRINSTKANPSTCALEFILSSTQLYFPNNSLLSLSHHQISSSSVSFPSKNKHANSTLPSPTIQMHKTSLDLTSSYYPIFLLPLIAKLIKGVIYIHCLSTFVPFFLNRIQIGFASHHCMKIALVKILLTVKFSVQ